MLDVKDYHTTRGRRVSGGVLPLAWRWTEHIGSGKTFSCCSLVLRRIDWCLRYASVSRVFKPAANNRSLATADFLLYRWRVNLDSWRLVRFAHGEST